jgi:Ankyrin repeat
MKFSVIPRRSIFTLYKGEQSLQASQYFCLQKILLSCVGVSPNCQTHGGQTPLHCVATKETSSCICPPRPFTVIPSYEMLDGRKGVYSQRHNIIEMTLMLLLKKGADPTLLDSEGATSYHYAARSGNTNFVDWISLIVPPDFKDYFGRTPYALAMNADHNSLIEEPSDMAVSTTWNIQLTLKHYLGLNCHCWILWFSVKKLAKKVIDLCDWYISYRKFKARFIWVPLIIFCLAIFSWLFYVVFAL